MFHSCSPSNIRNSSVQIEAVSCHSLNGQSHYPGLGQIWCASSVLETIKLHQIALDFGSLGGSRLTLYNFDNNTDSVSIMNWQPNCWLLSTRLTSSYANLIRLCSRCSWGFWFLSGMIHVCCSLVSDVVPVASLAENEGKLHYRALSRICLFSLQSWCTLDAQILYYAMKRHRMLQEPQALAKLRPRLFCWLDCISYRSHV